MDSIGKIQPQQLDLQRSAPAKAVASAVATKAVEQKKAEPESPKEDVAKTESVNRSVSGSLDVEA